MRKRIFSALLALCMLLGMLGFAPAVSAEEAKVTEIGTPEALIALMNDPDGWTGSYKLTADIDLSKYEGNLLQAPIGNHTTRFEGKFDGNKKTVKGVELTGAEGASVGFFGETLGAVITDLTVEGTIIGKGEYTGGIVGYAANDLTVTGCVNGCAVSGGSIGTAGIVGGNYTNKQNAAVLISGCVNKGAITGGTGSASGIFGYITSGVSVCTFTVTGCSNEGTVSNGKYTGGIIGYAKYKNSSCPLTISACTNSGKITGADKAYYHAGGILGFWEFDRSNATITPGALSVDQCVNSGDVEGTGTDSFAGGIVGQIKLTLTKTGSAFPCTITNCKNTGDVSGKAGRVGGILGSGNLSVYDCDLAVSGCQNEGAITGAGIGAGGILGYATIGKGTMGTLSITQCRNTGDVTSTQDAAGIAGYIICGVAVADKITVSKCQNDGDITATDKYAGGIVSLHHYMHVEDCMNTGAVSGTDAGGITSRWNGASAKKSLSYCYNANTNTGAGVAATASNGGDTEGTYTVSAAYYNNGGSLSDEYGGKAFTNDAFDTLNANGAWMLTAKGPELAAYHKHVWEKVDGTYHKCYCSSVEPQKHTFKDGFCEECGCEQPAVTLTIKAIDPHCETYEFNEELTRGTAVALDFDKITVTYEDGEWIANGLTLIGEDSLKYTLGQTCVAFTPDPADLVTVTVGTEETVYYKGQTVTLTAADPEEDYYFVGWFDESGNEVCSEQEYVFTATESVKLEARYSELPPVELTIKALDPNGKTCTFNETLTRGTDVTLDFTKITVAGKNGAWVATGLVLVGKDAYKYTLLTDSFALTPADADLVSVTVDGETTVYYKGQTVTVTAPAPADGYAFDGWYTDADVKVSGSGVYTFTATESVLLEARYTKLIDHEAIRRRTTNRIIAIAVALRNNKQCTVTIKSTGAADTVSLTVKKGDVVEIPAVPTKSGYTFVGWYKDINGTKPFDFTAKITGDVSIYAKWVQN